MGMCGLTYSLYHPDGFIGVEVSIKVFCHYRPIVFRMVDHLHLDLH